MLSKIRNQRIFDNFHENFYTTYHNSLYYYMRNINPEFSGLSEILKKIVTSGEKSNKSKKNSFPLKAIRNVKKKFDIKCLMNMIF